MNFLKQSDESSQARTSSHVAPRHDDVSSDSESNSEHIPLDSSDEDLLGPTSAFLERVSDLQVAVEIGKLVYTSGNAAGLSQPGGHRKGQCPFPTCTTYNKERCRLCAHIIDAHLRMHLIYQGAVVWAKRTPHLPSHLPSGE